MKKIIVLLFFTFWGIGLLSLYKYGAFDLDVKEIIQIINEDRTLLFLPFLLLFISRIFLLLPSSLFIVAGGILFTPLENILLSLFAMFIVESCIYIFGRYFQRISIHAYLSKKSPHLFGKLEAKKYTLLFITVASPMAPTDLACFLAASSKMSYGKYIFTVLLGNIPIILLYTFFGKSLLNSPILTSILTLIIVSVSLLTLALLKLYRKFHFQKLQEEQL